MTGHFRRASQVSIASNRSSGEASFDQACSKTPECASSSCGHVLHRQQSTTSVNSMASDSGLGAESLTSRGLHSHPSVHAKQRSPPVKQHSQLSMSSVDDPMEFDLERDSPVSGRSQTMPVRRQSNEYYNVGGSPPFDMDEEEGLRRHTMVPERNRSFRSSPPKKYLASAMPDYETMAPVKSLSTPPRNGLSSLTYQVEDARHYPQSQDTLLNGMQSMNLYDQVVISNPRSNYDNIHLQPSKQNYENTAIRFKPPPGN